jgi:hypothetical protein
MRGVMALSARDSGAAGTRVADAAAGTMGTGDCGALDGPHSLRCVAPVYAIGGEATAYETGH